MRPVILTIDDEPFIRQSFRDFLEDCDYNVIEAGNGQEGIEVFNQQQPDLLLLDLRMPGMDGLEVLAYIKDISPDTPIIIISGTGVMGDAVEALRLGAWDYILKPIEDMNVLQYSIDKCLERSRLLRENRAYKEHLEDMVRLRTAQLEETNRELAETRLQIIRRLGKAAEYKDNETGRHVIRVSIYSSIITEGLKLDPKTIDLIHLCSPMHDIGKIGIPDRILNKAGTLDTDEWIFMQQHCEFGNEMLQPLAGDDLDIYRSHTSIGGDILGGSDSDILMMARTIAACHHEHWDGTGYPNGLTGEDIPLPARIVTLADIYDALSSKRSYKEPFAEDKCQIIIRNLAGTFLDPQVVQAFFARIDDILTTKEHLKD